MSEQQNSFVAKTFGWMFLGLLLTGITSLFIMDNPSLMGKLVVQTEEGLTMSGLLMVLMMVELAMVFGLIFCLNKLPSIVCFIIFLGYAFLNGVTISPIVFSYTAASASLAFIVCSSMFGIMAIWGHCTNTDLTKMGPLLFMALIGLIVAMIVNMFLGSTMMDFIISCIAVVVFTLLTAFDAQKIKEMGRSVSYKTEEGKKASIMGALALYLDFINLFLHLLRLMGTKK